MIRLIPSLAYSRLMQIIWGVLVVAVNVLEMYLIANVLLALYGEKASVMQKLVFALWTGAVLMTGFVFLVVLLGGPATSDKAESLLISSPNPLFAVAFLYLGKRILKLSAVRSVIIMGNVYLLLVLFMNVHWLVESLFFVQSGVRFDYLKASVHLVVNLAIFVLFYRLLLHYREKKKFSIRLAEQMFVNHRRQVSAFLLKTVVTYALTIMLPLLLREEEVLAYTLNVLFLSLFYAVSLLYLLRCCDRAELGNRQAHIDALTRSIDEFGGIKHDFYNMLQTYNGFLAIGDLKGLKRYHATLLEETVRAGGAVELSRMMPRNPAFISLLINKTSFAEKVGVKFRTMIQCSVEDLYIDNFDICRCVACLLDNAIEAAMESAKRSVFFTIERKLGGSKLIIITNSTATPVDVNQIAFAGVTSKPGHSGLGLANVRKILGKYGNCTFQITHYNYEFSAYIELAKA